MTYIIQNVIANNVNNFDKKCCPDVENTVDFCLNR